MMPHSDNSPSEGYVRKDLSETNMCLAHLKHYSLQQAQIGNPPLEDEDDENFKSVWQLYRERRVEIVEENVK